MDRGKRYPLELEESTFEQVLEKGDLIEFIPRQSFATQYMSSSNGSIQNIGSEVDESKLSHWGVFIGSGKVVHLAEPFTHYCLNVIKEVYNNKEWTSELNAVYPKSLQSGEDKHWLVKSDYSMPTVRTDLLFDIAKIQEAVPYLNNTMDTKLWEGTSEEIVNVATFLEGKTMPHSFITKDCKDFAFFCRYGEIRSGLEKIEQHQQTTTKNRGMLGMVAIITNMFVL